METHEARAGTRLVLERPPGTPVGLLVMPRGWAAGEGSRQARTTASSPETAEPFCFQLTSHDLEPQGTSTHGLVMHGPPFCQQVRIRHQGRGGLCLPGFCFLNTMFKNVFHGPVSFQESHRPAWLPAGHSPQLPWSEQGCWPEGHTEGGAV